MRTTLKFKNVESVRDDIAMKGESISDFACRVSINVSLMSQYLNQKKRPSPPTAKKIATGLGKSIKDIFLL